MSKCHDEDNLGVVVSTDLSSAFDVVPHNTLLSKLEHYGFKGDAKELMESYLNNRTQFVKIQGKISRVIAEDMCSVLQGS